MTRVLIAEDNELLRTGISALLRNMPPDVVSVAGEARSGREVLNAMGNVPPDVVLMDIGMPDMDGIEATRILSERYPSVRVLVLSAHSDEAHIRRAFEAGARGYLLKTTSLRDLGAAIQTVGKGHLWLSPDAVVMRGLRSGDATSLTPRQREVLALIGLGCNTKEVAFRLGISPKTVDIHRASIMNRLGVRSLAALIRKAIDEGLTVPTSAPREQACTD